MILRGDNLGPIIVSSLDPATGNWIDHFTFQTEKIQRFEPIGDRLYAPAADPHGGQPDPEYAVGTATHDWGAGGICPARTRQCLPRSTPVTLPHDERGSTQVETG